MEFKGLYFVLKWVIIVVCVFNGILLFLVVIKFVGGDVLFDFNTKSIWGEVLGVVDQKVMVTFDVNNRVLFNSL